MKVDEPFWDAVNSGSDAYPPGFVPTYTKGSLFVGSLKHALDETVLRRFNVRLVVTAAWPYGSWPHQQRCLYEKLGIEHVIHPLIDSPTQVRDNSVRVQWGSRHLRLVGCDTQQIKHISLRHRAGISRAACHQLPLAVVREKPRQG